MIRVFDLSQPGRFCEEYPTTLRKDTHYRRDHVTDPSLEVNGIISCIAFSPWSQSDGERLFAAGSYCLLTGIYVEPDCPPVITLHGQQGGVTQVKFSPDGQFLFTGGRKDNHILCWDIRNTSSPLYHLPRVVQTNQKVYFDIDPSGSYLITGSQDGIVLVYDIKKNGELVTQWKASKDSVNGCTFHPSKPFLATSIGQRHYFLEKSNENGSEREKEIDNSILVWQSLYENEGT